MPQHDTTSNSGSRPLRVVHLITSLNIGGAETFLAQIVSTQDPRITHEVVCLTHGTPHIIERIKAAGVRIKTLNLSYSGLRLSPLIQFIWSLCQDPPDVVMSWLYHSDLIATLLRPFYRSSALVWNVRCSDLDMAHYNKLTAVIRWCLSRLSSRPNAVLFNSRAGLRTHFDLGYRAQQWSVIPNGFDTTIYRPNPSDRLSFRNEIRVGDEHLLIGVVARYDPMKDHETFFEVARQVKKTLPNARFLLAGDGTERENKYLVQKLIEMGIDESFHLLGRRNDLHRIYPGLDVLVSCSAFGEGFSNVVGEAMAAGVPCIVTNVGDSAHIVGETGKVVPPRDVMALTKAITDTLALPAKDRLTLSLSARDRIDRFFSLDTIRQKFSDYITDIHKESLQQKNASKNKRLRLLLACNQLAAGGTENQIIDLLKNLDKKAYRRSLFLVHHSSYRIYELLENGIAVFMPRSKYRFRTLSLLATSWNYISLQSKQRFDLVHFFLPETYVLCGMASLLVGPPRRIMSRRSLNIYQKNHRMAALIERFLHKKMSALLGNSQAVIEDLYNETPARMRKKTALIYNDVPTDWDDGNEEESSACKAQLGLHKNTLLLVIVANFYPYKGHQDLMEALGNVAEKLPQPWALACVGRDAGAMETAQRKARDVGIESKIHWLGHCGRERTQEIIKAADISVLCSHQEGFPNALLEAMSAGIACIATRVGGIPEIITDPSLGILVPPHNPNALGEAISELATDQKRRDTMARAASQSVEQRFSIGTMVNHHDRLYQAIMRDPAIDARAVVQQDDTSQQQSIS